MNDVRQEITSGILCGVREAAANLFKVAASDGPGHAKAGMVKIRDTATTLLALVDEVFKEEEASS